MSPGPKQTVVHLRDASGVANVEILETKPDRKDAAPVIAVPVSSPAKKGASLAPGGVFAHGLSPADGEDQANPIVSGTGAVATCFFFIGLLMFLVGFASHDWLGLDKGTSLSLWNQCQRHSLVEVWTCQAWEDTPGFIRAGQALCVVSLLLYALSVIILIAYLTVQFLQRVKVIIVALCVLIFAAGLMTLLALFILGVKGHDYLLTLQQDEAAVLHLDSLGVDISGDFYIGWSFFIVVTSALITFTSFTFCLVELVHVREFHA